MNHSTAGVSSYYFDHPIYIDLDSQIVEADVAYNNYKAKINVTDGSSNPVIGAISVNFVAQFNAVTSGGNPGDRADPSLPQVVVFDQIFLTSSYGGEKIPYYNQKTSSGDYQTIIYDDPNASIIAVPFISQDQPFHTKVNLNRALFNAINENYSVASYPEMGDLTRWSLGGVYIGMGVGGGPPPSVTYSPPPFPGSITLDAQFSNIEVNTDISTTYNDFSSLASISLGTIVLPDGPQFLFQDTSSGMSGTVQGTAYLGRYSGVDWKYEHKGSDPTSLAAPCANVFLQGGTSVDALMVTSGTNVLRAGSNGGWLVGAIEGQGTNTFVVDTTHSGTTWSEVINLHIGDTLEFDDLIPGTAALQFTESLGPTGFKGATISVFRYIAGSLQNDGTTIVTLCSMAHIEIDSFIVTTRSDSNYIATSFTYKG